MNDSKTLVGIRLEDCNPSLNSSSRGLTIFAASAFSTDTSGFNLDPVADAGADDEVEDTDDDSYETVTLDGSASSDPDGDIASWSPELTQRMAMFVQAFKDIRHLTVQDFYQLLPLPATARA